mgnify:CR=1 FL=1
MLLASCVTSGPEPGKIKDSIIAHDLNDLIRFFVDGLSKVVFGRTVFGPSPIQELSPKFKGKLKLINSRRKEGFDWSNLHGFIIIAYSKG